MQWLLVRRSDFLKLALAEALIPILTGVVARAEGTQSIFVNMVLLLVPAQHRSHNLVFMAVTMTTCVVIIPV